LPALSFYESLLLTVFFETELILVVFFFFSTFLSIALAALFSSLLFGTSFEFFTFCEVVTIPLAFIYTSEASLSTFFLFPRTFGVYF
jgi:hypothetical protein